MGLWDAITDALGDAVRDATTGRTRRVVRISQGLRGRYRWHAYALGDDGKPTLVSQSSVRGFATGEAAREAAHRELEDEYAVEELSQ